MTNLIREYVNITPIHTVNEIVKSFEEFENTGFTGETPIRIHTEELMKQIKFSNSCMFGVFAADLAKECYRRLMIHYRSLV